MCTQREEDGGGAVILCAVMVFKGLFLCTERP